MREGFDDRLMESELGFVMRASECQKLGMRFMENGVKEEGVLGGEKKRGLLDEFTHSPSEPVEQPVRHHLTRVMRPLEPLPLEVWVTEWGLLSNVSLSLSLSPFSTSSTFD